MPSAVLTHWVSRLASVSLDSCSNDWSSFGFSPTFGLGSSCGDTIHSAQFNSCDIEVE